MLVQRRENLNSMEREICIVTEETNIGFEKAVNKLLKEGCVPHWETFRVIKLNLIQEYFYMIMERKIEGAK